MFVLDSRRTGTLHCLHTILSRLYESFQPLISVLASLCRIICRRGVKYVSADNKMPRRIFICPGEFIAELVSSCILLFSLSELVVHEQHATFVLAFSDFFCNVESCSFFFNLLAYIAPQEIL